MEQKHKRVKHFNVEGHAHMLTFSCVRHWALLGEDSIMQLLSACIDRALQRHACMLIAFVYMPDHVHLIVWPRRAIYEIDEVLYAIKKPFSDRMKDHLSRTKDPLLHKLTVRERVGKTTFRFWEKGPGHDRNIIERETLSASVDYIHNNPVRRGLVKTVDNWRWSSRRHYYEPGMPADPALPIVHGFPP